MFATGIFHAINIISESGRAEAVIKTVSSSSSVDSVNNVAPAEVIDDQPRFPSTSAPSVELIFGGLTLGHAIFGIVSVTQERANFLATYSHLLLISFFLKMLFLIASAGMHSLTPNRPFLTSVTVLGILSATVELILVMCVCNLTHLVKRGDAARQEIQSIHSYRLERRSRSRSQSRMRSFYTISTDRIYRPNISATQTPAHSRHVSPSGSFQDLSMMTESASYYVPPPIFLKLDR